MFVIIYVSYSFLALEFQQSYESRYYKQNPMKMQKFHPSAQSAKTKDSRHSAYCNNIITDFGFRKN